VSAVFITSSGTGIGKTLVVTALAHQLRERGRPVRALKPVMTGFDPGDLEACDAGRILTSLGRPVTEAAVRDIAPWRYRAPLSPDMAAAREGREVDVDEVVAWCRDAIAEAARDNSTLLIEGIGGVMVPLDERRTVLDWIAALASPSIVVVGTYLGSLSHALTALAALRGRGLSIAGIVISESEAGAAPLDEVARALARHTAPLPLVAVPRLAEGDAPGRTLPDLVGLVNRAA
jgi:dethiobiotin synthetase